jgi:hypothetical protein
VRDAVIERTRVSPAHKVPDVALSESHFADSETLHPIARFVGFWIVTDAVVAVVPKSTDPGVTWTLAPLAPSESTPMGEEPQPTANRAQRADIAARRTDKVVGCT